MRFKFQLGGLLATVALAAMTVVGCQNKEAIGSANLPKNAATQLAQSQKTWNGYMGNTVRLESWAIVGTISDAEKKAELLAKITAPETIIGFGNLEEKATVRIGSLKKLAAEELLASQKTMLAYADTTIRLGDQIVEIQWASEKEGRFTSLCIVRESGIVWDNLLTGVMIVKQDGLFPPNALSATDRVSSKYYSEYWNAYWIGTNTLRGQIGYKITIYYYCNTNKVCSTDKDDWGWMNLGSAQSESQTLVNSGQLYGQIKYAIGLATPAATVSFSSSTFKVTVSGIGSNIVQNGTKSLYP